MGPENCLGLTAPTVSSDPVATPRVWCTAKRFCVRAPALMRFSMGVGWRVCAIELKASPKIPAMGSPLKSADSVVTAPKY
jgi:hypothetical protein